MFTFVFITFFFLARKINVPIFTVKSSALYKSFRYFSPEKEQNETNEPANSKRNGNTHLSVSNLDTTSTRRKESKAQQRKISYNNNDDDDIVE